MYMSIYKKSPNRNLSRTTKLILYKTFIQTVLLYGAEAWTLLSTDVADLGVFDRKALRKVFGPVRVRDDFRIRYNSELYELLNEMDVVKRINIQRLRWFGHVVRMQEDVAARRIFDAGTNGSQRKNTTLYMLVESNRGSPVIDWCDQPV